MKPKLNFFEFKDTPSHADEVVVNIHADDFVQCEYKPNHITEEKKVIRSFRAIDDPETCEKFYEGHINTLRSYGINKLSSAKKEWFTNPAVYGVIAEQKGKVLGGVKIHKVEGTQLLPMEDGVGYLDESLFDIVKKHAEEGGAGEACGLWNAREVSGWGLSRVMMLAIISISNQLNLKTLFALTSDHTFPLFQSLGYRVIKSLGNNGDFVYPTPAYLTRVIKMNANTLSGSSTSNRNIVYSLKEQPIQSRLEKSKRGELEVNYELLLPNLTAKSLAV